MASATEQVLRGDNVNVAGLLENKDFVGSPENEAQISAVEQVIKEEGYSRITEQQIANRDQKYAEVIGKRDVASLELDNLNKQLSELEATPDPWRIFAGQDTALIERIDGIERQLQDGGITKRERSRLEQEQVALQDEYNTIIDSSGVEKAQKSIDAIEQQRKDLLKKVDQKERQVERYQGEINKRAMLISEQRVSPPEPEQAILSEAPTVRTKTEAVNPESKDANLPESASGNGATMTESPEIAIARTIATEKPNTMIPVSETEILSATEALAQADNAIQEATNFSKLFGEAVSCFIRNGA